MADSLIIRIITSNKIPSPVQIIIGINELALYGLPQGTVFFSTAFESSCGFAQALLLRYLLQRRWASLLDGFRF